MDLNHARLPIPPRGHFQIPVKSNIFTERDAYYIGLLGFVNTLAEVVKKKHHVAVQIPTCLSHQQPL